MNMGWLTYGSSNKGWLNDRSLSFAAWILLTTFLAGCAFISSAATVEADPVDSSGVNQEAQLEADSPKILAPDAWKELPVVPEVSETAVQIYRKGIEKGNDPHAFSKVGYCQNVPSMFLAPFADPREYSLGEQYAHLQPAIDWFDGSFERESLAVSGGLNAASVLSPTWADPTQCEPGETPLECELRNHRPIIAMISLETWWDKEPGVYESYLREIIEITIEHGTVPVLSTKADNLEGGHRINAAIAQLAYEYDVPLWNFWKAVQPLHKGGLSDDNFHLTYAGNYFDDPQRMEKGWPWRNLTALQTLDAVWRAVTSPDV
jgi:hypothetical protein